MTSSSAKRTVVLHEDDVGMCHGANTAFLELTRLGVCSSGAVMVPCPWFLEIAEAAAADRSLDLGVHLTLTAEKRHYKWGPLTRASPRLRPHRRVRLFLARRGDAARQGRARSGRGRASRADRPCLSRRHRRHPSRRAYGRAMSPEFCEIYSRLGVEYRLPILLTSTFAAYTPNDNLVGVTEATFRPGVELARARGFRLFDAAIQTTWGRAESASGRSALQGAGRRHRAGQAHLLLPALQRAGRT